MKLEKSRKYDQVYIAVRCGSGCRLRKVRVSSINMTLFVLVLVTMLPVVGIILFSGIEHRKSLELNAERNIFLTTSSMAQVQKDLTTSVRQTLTVLSLLPEVQKAKSTETSVIFKSIVWQNQEYHNISLVALDGSILASAKPFGAEVNLGDRKHVRQAIEKRDFAIGEFVLGRTDDATPIFAYAYPVFDDKLELVSVLTASIKLDYFTNFHEFADMPENAFIAATDHRGIRLFYHPAKEETNPVGKAIKAKSWEIVRELSLEGERGSFSGSGSDGISRIFAFEQLRLTKNSPAYMYVFAGIPEKHILQPARDAIVKNMQLLVATIGLALLIFLLMGRKVLTEPITRLIDVTEKFKKGEFTPSRESCGGPKELRVLSDTFFDMATELTESQQRLQNSEAKFRAVIDQASDAIYTADETGNFLLANRRACETMGYSEEEFLKMNVADIDPFFSRRSDIEDVWEPMVEGTTTFLETIHRAKSGREFPVEVSIGRVNIGNDGVILGIVRDISVRKEFEASLHKSKEEWESTFNAISDIITIQNRDMRIMRANKVFHDSFPEYPSLDTTPPCYEIFHSDKQVCDDCPAQRTLKDKKPHRQEVVEGAIGKIYDVATYPILDDTGEVDRIVHIVKDITETKKLEEELFQSHKMEAVGTLAGGIAHDFNNILSAIMGFAEFIEEDAKKDSQTAQDAAEILNATNRAKDLVKQILTFSRKSDREKIAIKPQQVVEEAVNMLRSTLPTSVMIVEEIKKDCCSILVNATNLHQVVLNLCANARHAMENDKGVLRIELTEVMRKQDYLHSSQEKPYVLLRVTDNGCGIAADKLERIFEPYYTTREVGSGSGLGLSVTHGIVEDCNGFIEVESVLGEGSVFSVFFPCHLGQVESEESVSTSRSREAGTGGRILMVDDEPLLLKINSRRLQSLGFTIELTESSHDALQRITQNPQGYDLLITDQTMPELTGEELAREAMQLNSELPIIVCTGHSESFTEEMALAMGIKKYVFKPVLGDELIDAVKEVLSC